MLVRYEFKAMLSQRYQCGLGFTFVLLAMVLFPLLLHRVMGDLSLVAPTLVVIVYVLAHLLALDGLFKSDYEQGLLPYYILSHYPLWLICLIKTFVFYCVISVPLAIFCFPLALSMDLAPWPSFVLLGSLLLGAPILLLVGSIVSLLVCGLSQSVLLLIALVLPFYVPVIIFMGSPAYDVLLGGSFAFQWFCLAAMLCLSLVLCPYACAQALRLKGG